MFFYKKNKKTSGSIDLNANQAAFQLWIELKIFRQHFCLSVECTVYKINTLCVSYICFFVKEKEEKGRTEIANMMEQSWIHNKSSCFFFQIYSIDLFCFPFSRIIIPPIKILGSAIVEIFPSILGADILIFIETEISCNPLKKGAKYPYRRR